MVGFVSLVGAGPGDPELLTVRAVDRLARADLVLHDALVNPEVLSYAPNARRFYVGKRANQPSMEQEMINTLLIKAAQRGERVVRLKCGDPFVFGRGGEEALALQRAHIPFEVVPGLSTALCAPALSGIPVTHRGLSSAFMVLSGHHKNTYRPLLENLAPNSITVVMMMAIAARQAIAQLLLARNWNPRTPVAVVLGASSARSFTWTGTLQELKSENLPNETADLPGVLVIGQVVSVAEVIAQVQPQESALVAEAL